MQPLPRDEGLTTPEVLDLLRTSSSNIPVLQSVPNGTKNDVYCLVDNTKNIKQRAEGLHSMFVDDSSGSTRWHALQSFHTLKTTMDTSGESTGLLVRKLIATKLKSTARGLTYRWTRNRLPFTRYDGTTLHWQPTTPSWNISIVRQTGGCVPEATFVWCQATCVTDWLSMCGKRCQQLRGERRLTRASKYRRRQPSRLPTAGSPFQWPQEMGRNHASVSGSKLKKARHCQRKSLRVWCVWMMTSFLSYSWWLCSVWTITTGADCSVCFTTSCFVLSNFVCLCLISIFVLRWNKQKYVWNWQCGHSMKLRQSWDCCNKLHVKCMKILTWKLMISFS